MQTRWTRLGIGLTVAPASAASLVLAVMAAFLGWEGSCDGDGGYPFAARASSAHQMCTSTFGDVYFWVQIGLPVLLVLVLGTYAVVKARWGGVLIGIATSIAVTVTMAAVLASLPNSCSDQQRRTLDSYDCETYSSP